MKRLSLLLIGLLFAGACYAGISQVMQMVVARKNVGGDFSPSDIASLLNWYDIDSIVGATNNQPIAAWTDSQGSLDLAQSSEILKPFYKTSVQNGKDAILFDGSNDRMFNASIVLTQAYTIAWVGKIVDATPVASDYWFDGDNGADRAAMHVVTAGNDTLYAGSSSESFGAADENWNIYILLVNGASSSLQKDNGSPVVVSGTPGPDHLAGMNFAASKDPGNFGNVYFGEILLFDAALSGGDTTSLVTYLNGRWATH